MAGLMERLQPVASHYLFGVISLVVTMAVLLVLGAQGQKLATDEAPRGVLSLEFAWTGDGARTIIGSWKGYEDVAVRQVLLDFIFIAGYGCFLLFLGLTAEKVARTHGLPSLAYAAHLAAWAGVIAGVFDCFENFGLLAMIQRGPTTAVALPTSLFATVKFALAVGAIAVSLTAFAFAWIPLLRTTAE